MTRRANSLGSTPTAISREIDSQYDNVKIVADNIDSVNSIAIYVDDIVAVSDAVVSSAEVLTTAIDELGVIETNVTDARDVTLAARDTTLVSETNAQASEQAAASSADTALVAETNASISEVNAALSESAAANSATSSETSRIAAATSETNAANSATAASTSESNAATSATSAEDSKNIAVTAQLAAESYFDQFTDIYLGAFASDPITDNDGDPLVAGTFYFNTSTGLKIYTGSIWDPAVFDVANTVVSFNGRDGAVTLVNSDVTTATGQSLDETGTPKFASIQVTGGVNPNDGLMSWNTEDETVDLATGPNTTYQLGQELGAVARNMSGVTINNGTVVKLQGASGDKITIDIADNTSPAAYGTCFAIATDTISNNSTGKVTTEGLVRGLNTSVFTEGASLWLGTSGGYTDIHPVSPAGAVHIGWVVRSHANNGSIYVKISNSNNLGDSNDVLITTPQDNEVVAWDSASSLWKNIAIDKAYVDALEVDAGTLDGLDSTAFELADSTILKDADIGITLQPYDIDTVIDSAYVHTDNNFDNTYKQQVNKNTAIAGIEILNRYDKLLNNLDINNIEYGVDGLSTVIYQGDDNTNIFYRNKLNYTSGVLSSIQHFYNTSDTITPSGTTTLSYTNNDLTSTTYTE